MWRWLGAACETCTTCRHPCCAVLCRFPGANDYSSLLTWTYAAAMVLSVLCGVMAVGEGGGGARGEGNKGGGVRGEQSTSNAKRTGGAVVAWEESWRWGNGEEESRERGEEGGVYVRQASGQVTVMVVVSLRGRNC